MPFHSLRAAAVVALALACVARLPGARAADAGAAVAAADVAAASAPAPAPVPAVAPPATATPAGFGPPAWPPRAAAPAGAPNVLVIMTDDVGFGASSTFGGPIPTPTLDALAAQGLRYNRFHTTALCSPTRAALLTGRTPHNVGVGIVTNLASGYPGYTSVIPRSAATVARVLRDAGYSTAMFGKGHITPEWEMSQAGPFDRWPTGLGFQYFYGFLGADTSQFAPWLVENTTPVEPARGRAGYFLEADLADHAIAWLRQQRALAPQQPFFVYLATAGAHAPNHAPREWLARFAGRFDGGWDRMRAETYARQRQLGVIPRDAALTPRPASLPAWDTLPGERRALHARYMEAYAAALSFADAQVGRVIDSLKASGQYENTLVIYVQGDNGATAEGRQYGRMFEQSGVNNLDEDLDWVAAHRDDIGGPASYPLMPGGWGWALNAPFQHYKRVASHLGGIRNGMVVSWPARIHDAGGLRTQFQYVSDLMPTILEAAGVAAPAVIDGVAQQPLDGVSFAASFADARAPSRHETQVFEMFENLGLYHDGWMLSTQPSSTPWDADPGRRLPLAQRRWELYDLRSDFSQAHDLAAAQPQRLAQMQALFWQEAARNQLLPIHGGAEGREGTPSLTNGRSSFSYAPGVTNVPENAAPHTLRRAHRIIAEVLVPDGGARGVLVTQGGHYGGYALYLHEGRVVYHYNAVEPRHYAIRSRDALPPGRHRIVVDVVPESAKPGAALAVTIAVDGQAAGSGRVEQTLTAWMSHTEGFDVGEDRITAVSDDYDVDDSRFTGVLERLEIELR